MIAAETGLHEARRLCRELGGERVDLWSAPQQVVERAAQKGGRRALRDAARDVVSAVLIRAVQSGDEPARRELGSLWREDVSRWCRWNAGRSVQADDAAQEVLLRLMRDCHRVAKPDSVGSWVRGLMFNTLREHERRARRLPTLVQRFWDRADTAPTPDEHVVLDERARLVREVLQDLPAEQRYLLWSHYVEGLGREAIATALDMPRGTLNRKMTGARQAFEKAARRRGLGGSP